jgi:serine/threonine-protein kinase
VPDIAPGTDLTAALDALTQAGYEPSQRSESSDTVEVGDVIGTDPEAGTFLASGETVVVLVSSGPAPTTTEAPTTSEAPTTVTTAPPDTTATTVTTLPPPTTAGP